jgi:hypothetical protein
MSGRVPSRSVDPFHSVHVHADPAIAAGAVVWRYRDALQLTAVVKATFSVPADAPMSLIQPEGLLAEDARLDGHGSWLRPGDRTPYRSRADVLFHAPWRPAGKPSRVALRGRAGHLLDRVLPAGEDTALLGPIARPWPAAPILEIPADFDWAHAQSAPVEQQTGFLRGDEWIVAEALHATEPVVSSRLPDVRATAVAHGVASGAPWSRPLTLNADLLLLDLAANRCVIVWRGVLALGSIDALATTRLDLGLELAGRPVRSPSPGAAAQQAAPAAPPRASAPEAGRPPASSSPTFERTTALTPPAAPKRAAPPARFEGTMDLTAETGRPSAMPTPFPIGAPSATERAAPIAGAPWSASPATKAPAPRRDFEQTLTLRDGGPAPIAGAPWSAARATPAPAPRSDFEQTLTLRDGPEPSRAPAPAAAPPIAIVPIVVSPIAPVSSTATPPLPPPPLLTAPSPGRDPRAQISRRLPKRKS